MSSHESPTTDDRNNKDLIASSNEYAPKEVGELDLYQKREKIYTRNIEGFF